MSLIKSPTAIAAGGLLLTAAITALLVAKDYVPFEMVPIIAIAAMGLFFAVNLGRMLWPGIKKEYSGGTSLWQILMKILLVLLFLSIPMLGGLGIFLFFVIFIVRLMLPNGQKPFYKAAGYAADEQNTLAGDGAGRATGESHCPGACPGAAKQTVMYWLLLLRASGNAR